MSEIKLMVYVGDKCIGEVSTNKLPVNCGLVKDDTLNQSYTWTIKNIRRGETDQNKLLADAVKYNGIIWSAPLSTILNDLLKEKDEVENYTEAFQKYIDFNKLN